MTSTRRAAALVAMVLGAIGFMIALKPQAVSQLLEPFSAYMAPLPVDTSAIQNGDFLYILNAGVSKKLPGTTFRNLMIDTLTAGGSGVSTGTISISAFGGATNTFGLCTGGAVQILNQGGTGAICLPSSTGTAGQVLTSSGSPTLPDTWTTPSSGGGGGVTAWNARTGAVVPATNDYNFNQIGGTVGAGQLPLPTASSLGGIESITCASGQFLDLISTSGSPGCATPAGGGNVSTSGGITVGNCAQWNGATTLISTSAPCGSGGGGSTGGYTDYVNIKTYGATGDGTCHALSTAYSTLAAAQAVYPFVSDLTQCIDWAAIQQAINVAYNSAPAGLFGPGSSTVYCPEGNYELSNPIISDQPNNTAGTAAAWAVGTTYAYGQQVKYNGLPWVSAGSGNVGNPPTAYDLFPSNIQPGGGGNYATAFPWAPVTISNGSPAVVTINTTGGFGGGSSNVSNGMQLVFFPQQYANPNGGSAPALPTGVNAQQVYYARDISGNTFHLATTPGGTAINTSSAGVGTFFVSGQVWQIQPNSSAAGFSSRIALVGVEGMPSNAGCIWQTQFNWTSPAVIIGPQNGVIVKNISVIGQVQGGGFGSPGNNGYRCTAPYSNNGPAQATGATVAAIGWAIMSNGGGATRTKFENVSSGGFYINDLRSYGTNGEIADHNTWVNVNYSGSCVGIDMAATQAFINNIHDSTIGMTTTGVYANLQEGVKVDGGDWSTFDSLANSFAISSVSTTSGCGYLCVTATITAPDNNFQTAMCAYSAGAAFNTAGEPTWLNAWPFASGCGYNTFIIKTAQWGAIGMYIMNYNPFTFQATFGIPKAYNAIYQGGCCGSNLATEIAAATTLYAVEAVMPFFGDNQVDTIHLENDGVPYTLSCFCTTFFGGVRPVELKNIYIQVEASLGTSACCNAPQNNKGYYRFLAQQVIPYLNSSSGDTIIDHLVGGGNTFVSGLSAVDQDRLLLATGIGNYVEMRHTTGSSLNNGQSSGSDWNASAPLFDFYPREEYAIPLVGGTQGQLSGGYVAYGGQAYGSGTWDNGSQLGPFSIYSLSAGGQPTDMANIWRTRGWGQAPQWGVRPAPWTSPCILPSQATSLASLPAITYVANLNDIVPVASGGSNYAVNDTITLAGGTGTAAVLVVKTLSGSAVATVQVQSTGAYTVVPATTFTQASSSGGGTGATFTATGPIWFVNYVIGYPMLWGGHIYKACNYNNASFTGTKYAIASAHQAWTYGQNLTTTNVPHLSWTMDGASPFVYMNPEALSLMFPGLQFSLASDGTGGCTTIAAQNFIVLEVHPSLGYVKVVRADTDGGPFVPSLAASGTTCKNTTIGQQSFILSNPY